MSARGTRRLASPLAGALGIMPLERRPEPGRLGVMRALAGTRARSRPMGEKVSGAENRRLECGAMCGMLWEGGDLEGRLRGSVLSWCQREITQ